MTLSAIRRNPVIVSPAIEKIQIFQFYPAQYPLVSPSKKENPLCRSRLRKQNRHPHTFFPATNF